MAESEKSSVCRIRRRLQLPCRNCVYFEQPICKKTYKERKKKRNEST